MLCICFVSGKCSINVTDTQVILRRDSRGTTALSTSEEKHKGKSGESDIEHNESFPSFYLLFPSQALW